MGFRRDKDLAWVITFTSFLIFLLSSIACSILESGPRTLPEPVVLANANFGKAFTYSLFRMVRYASLAALGFGIFRVITWPPGPGSS